MSVFIPTISDSAKLKEPLIKGSPANLKREVSGTLSVTATSISLSGLRTATEYLSPFRIIIPSITACPPIPLYFIHFPQ